MSFSRRHFIVLGLTTFAVGCSQAAQKTAGLPGMAWPEVEPSPTPTGRSAAYTTRPTPTAVRSSEPTIIKTSSPSPAVVASVGPVIIPRASWTTAGPKQNLVNPMRAIQHITLHHEGAPGAPIRFTDEATTKARLERIRRFHISRNWADIGYHYVIDRAGRIWEGRSISFQGAHVKDHNENNIGVMLLGNFDLQAPTDEQLETMQRLIRSLRTEHKIPIARIKTHQELMPTACPGKHLQPRIASLRSNGGFG